MTKQQIRQLLKGNLTGKERAILVLQDAWEKDHDREGFLTDADVQRLKGGLKASQAIQEYNSLVELYRIMIYTLQSIRISALETAGVLREINRTLYDLYVRAILREQAISSPVIMTEKQYEDIKAKQRQLLLDAITLLSDALAGRAYELASKEQQEQADFDTQTLAFDYPELLSLAASQYQEQIQAGALRPVMLTEKQIQRLKEIEAQEEETRQAMPEPPEDYKQGWLEWYTKYFPEDAFDRQQIEGLINLEYYRMSNKTLSRLDHAREALQRQLYQEGLQAWSQEQAQRLLEGLDILKAQPEMLDTEEHPGLEWLLSWTYCSGAQLYETGFPEQVQWIDEYKPGLTEEAPFAHKVAIILEPAKHNLDEQGYYKAKTPWETMEQYLTITGTERQLQEEGSNLAQHLQDFITAARAGIRDFLASQAVTEAVSKAVDIPFTEDTEQDFEHIQNAVRRYNLLAKPEPSLSHLPAGLALPEIRIARMRPRQETVQHLRERIAMALGQSWWEEIKGIEMEFEQSLEEDEQ